MKMQNKNRFVGIAFAVIVSLTVLGGSIFGQTQDKWKLFTNEAKTFSVLVPPNFLIDRENDKVRIYASNESISVVLSAEKIDKPKKYVKALTYPSKTSTSSDKLEIGDFFIRQFDNEKDSAFSTAIYAGSSNDYFSIAAAAKDRKDPILVSFLQSIRFEGQPIVASSEPKPESAETPLIIDKQDVSLLVKESLAKPDAKTAKIIYDDVKEKGAIFEPGYSRGLIMLRKPKPTYTDSARQNNKQGTIMAKVEFLKDGQIGNIVVDRRLDKGLAVNVANVVKQIKFIPAEIDGKAVDATRILEYGFSIY